MSNLFEHDNKLTGRKLNTQGYKTVRATSRSNSPRIGSPHLQKRDAYESSAGGSPTPFGISQLQSSQKSDRETPKAYVADRKPTIYESACVNFLGVKEQRPVELLKMEL